MTVNVEDQPNESNPPVNEVVVTTKEVADPSDKFTLSEVEVPEGATVVSNEIDEQSSINDRSQTTAKANDTTKPAGSFMSRLGLLNSGEINRMLANMTEEQKEAQKERHALHLQSIRIHAGISTVQSGVDEVNDKASLILKNQEKIMEHLMTPSTPARGTAYTPARGSPGRTPMSSRSRLEKQKRSRPPHSAAMSSKKAARIHGFNDHVGRIRGNNQEE